MVAAGSGGKPDGSPVTLEGFPVENKATGSDLRMLLYKGRVDAVESMVYELVDKFKHLESENGKLKEMVLEVKEKNEAI